MSNQICRLSPKILPMEGYPLPIPKKNAWIVWVIDKAGRIEDLEVYDVGFENSSKWEATKWRINKKIKNRHYYDLGCCLQDWDKWTLLDLIVKFGFQENYVSEDIRLYVFNCLGYVEEWEKQIFQYSKILRKVNLNEYTLIAHKINGKMKLYDPEKGGYRIV